MNMTSRRRTPIYPSSDSPCYFPPFLLLSVALILSSESDIPHPIMSAAQIPKLLRSPSSFPKVRQALRKTSTYVRSKVDTIRRPLF
ncbi:hypothetical protein BDN70DRAFT_615701 [Pholiota conissans]|uniref:Uncharacterized protein n=1 Tax=Pholiota conissans TaxID=109636 RepID=A0A9P5YJJ1_9AGAR|nr:hypothetical protein BDN70DRAFT_615701 [Pholiota conissans]